MDIQKSARLANILHQWSSDRGKGHAAYSVASRMTAGCAVAHDDQYVGIAVAELKDDLAEARRELNPRLTLRHRKREEAEEDVAQLTELVGWLSGPFDTCRHFVSGEVHVWIDCVDVNEPRAEFAGRVVVRDDAGEVRIWPFDELREPQMPDHPADSDEGLARAAASIVDFFGTYGPGNRGDVPSWAPPAEIAELIQNGAEYDDKGGEITARLALPGEEP